MRPFCHAIAVTGLVTAFAFPAHAASHSMDATMVTCAIFTAMDAEGQAKSMEAMQKALDDMALDKMMPDEMAADATATDELAADDMTLDDVTALVSVCEGKPDMMALDALMSNQG